MHRTLAILLIGALAFCPDRATAADRPDWVLEGIAPWQARDSQGECVFRDRLWILGGWFSSQEPTPRDVWSSADGRTWKQASPAAPWLHGDLPMTITFRERLETKTAWKARHEHSAFVFREKLWVAGGHARPLSNEVWSLHLPPDWTP